MSRERFIMIGGVAAGMSAASKIRSLKPEAEITVFERSGYVSYIACGMPYLIGDIVKSSESLVAYDSKFFQEQRNIQVFLHHEVLKIFPERKAILIRDLTTGQERDYGYDKLLVSTGARPLLPPIKGTNLKGVFTLRLLEEGIQIKNYITENKPRKGLIIGAGNIGMEVAEAFSARGLKVVIVEKMPSILGSMDAEINEAVEKELNQNGVELIKSKAVVEFAGENSIVKKAVMEDGQEIETDIALISAGIRPNSELAEEASIEMGSTGAIKVNQSMETNLPDIYAAGDCAETYHLLYKRNVYIPLGTTANKQGRIAGENMAGGETLFNGVIGTSIFKVFGLEVGRTGITENDAKREGIEYVANVIEQYSRAHYFPGVSRIRVKLVADKKTGKLLGAQMAGKEGVSKRIDVFAAAITAGMTAEEVGRLDLGYAPPFAPVYDPILIAATEIQKKIS